MKFAFHYRKPFTRQLALFEAMRAGCARHGVEVIAVEGFEGVRPEVDGLILFGIGGISREIFDAYSLAGKSVVFWDKGYTDRAANFRVAVNEFQPLTFLREANVPGDRLAKLQLDVKPYRTAGDYLLFDGASNKFCLWQGLGDWQEWGARTTAQLQKASRLPVKYRPRPSHNIRETLAPFADDLAGAAIVASYGGNIGFDCVVNGVPHFALGDSPALDLSEVDWAHIDQPRVPAEHERERWLRNIAYCQWSLAEIESGRAWGIIKGWL